MAKAKKHRRYKTPKTILRKTLAYFKANPENWTRLTLRRQNAKADDGLQIKHGEDVVLIYMKLDF